MLSIIIPLGVIKEIELTIKNKKIIKKEKKKHSKEEILSLAKKNFQFLSQVAKLEPIYSFIKDGNNKVMILSEFSDDFPDNSFIRISTGILCLETIDGKAGLYYWHDADFPANRSNRDHHLITENDLDEWSTRSLEIFSDLTEQKIWKNAKEWLRTMRKI